MPPRMFILLSLPNRMTRLSLKQLGEVTVHAVHTEENVTQTKLKLGEDSLTANVSDEDALYLLEHTYGTFTRGESTMLLNYRCKTGPSLGHDAWKRDTKELLDLDLVPMRKEDKIQVQVFLERQARFRDPGRCRQSEL